MMIQTMEDFVHSLGDIPLSRIRYHPVPGTATEQDVLAMHVNEKRLCELVDGVLVEKAMGYSESTLAGVIFIYLHQFVRPRRLGIVAGADGMLKLATGLVRIPDVSFVSWDRIVEGKVPRQPIPRFAPNLAVEVLSEGNTRGEMERKRHEYFTAGVLLVWIVDPEKRIVTVYTSFDNAIILTESETLDGGTVLPGFALSLRDLFAELDQTAP